MVWVFSSVFAGREFFFVELLSSAGVFVVRLFFFFGGFWEKEKVAEIKIKLQIIKKLSVKFFLNILLKSHRNQF